MFPIQEIPSALSLARDKDGINKDINIAIIDITVSNSIIVKLFLITSSSITGIVKPVVRLEFAIMCGIIHLYLIIGGT
jgi:hypothetical protein